MRSLVCVGESHKESGRVVPPPGRRVMAEQSVHLGPSLEFLWSFFGGGEGGRERLIVRGESASTRAMRRCKVTGDTISIHQDGGRVGRETTAFTELEQSANVLGTPRRGIEDGDDEPQYCQAVLTSAVGLEIKLSSHPTSRMRGRCARFSHVQSLRSVLEAETRVTAWKA